MTSITTARQNTVCSEGTHTFKIVKSEEKMGGSGYPYWKFQMNCVDEGADKGQAVWANISLAPQARFKVDQFLDAISAPTKGEISHEQCVGATLRCTVVWETYNGSVQAKIDAFIPAGSTATPKSSAPKVDTNGNSLPSDATTPGFKAPF